MTASVDDYVALITNEHRDKPKYVAFLKMLVQPLVDTNNAMESLSFLYALDTAVGDQLDTVGEWVGVSRQLKVPIAGVYFSFDTVGLGFDEGVWLGPFDDPSGIVSLPDDHYRTLIRARILNNHWDGSVEKAYAIWDALFAGTGFSIYIVDHGDLTMSLGLIGPTPDALTVALFTGGFLDIKPAGVRIRGYFLPTDGPIFAFDENNANFAGFDIGSWVPTA